MRVISADALVMKEISPGIYLVDGEAIRNAPTFDAEPVVRCGECKYRFQNQGHKKNGCPIFDARIWMDDNDFCSHGERRDE